MKGRFFAAIMLVLLLVMSQIGLAEQPYIDLSERFGDQETYEYGGMTYYLRPRVDTMLVLCANLSEADQQGMGSAELILLMPVDDEAKKAAPIELDENMIAGWLEGEAQSKTLGQLFDEAESPEAACEKMMETLNALFPADVIGHYALLDLRGLPVLDGIENDESNTAGERLIERLRSIKQSIEENNGADVNAMLNDLSGYIITDMKSGAMMKLVDKAERYDRTTRIIFPVLESTQESDEAPVPDLDAFEKVILDIYYSDTGIWDWSDHSEREN